MLALVLKKIPYGEADLIVTFLGDDNRIYRGFASAARKSRRRFPHQFAPDGLYQVEGLVFEKLSRIQRCDIVDIQHKLSKSWDSLCRWSQVVDWLMLNETNTIVFSALRDLWASLGSDFELSKFLNFFANEVRNHGLMPDLHDCLRCHQKIMDTVCHFLPSEGRVAHTNCSEGLPMRREQLDFLEGKEIDLSFALLFELERILLSYLEWQVGKRFRAREMMAQTTNETLVTHLHY